MEYYIELFNVLTILSMPLQKVMDVALYYIADDIRT